MLKSIYRNWKQLCLIPFYRNIGYIGWLGYGNLGDEVLYVSLKKLFSRFNTIPYKYTEKILAIENVLHRKYYDAVCIGGGTLIGTEYIREFQLAQEQHDFTFIFGAGVRNPIFWDNIKDEKISISAWVASLNKCAFVGVRGPLSKKILSEHGYHNAEVIGDPAILCAGEFIKPKNGNRVLGINIGISGGKVWGNEEDILYFIVRYSKAMIAGGWRIKFLPVWNKDIPYIQEACRRIGKDIEVFSEYHSITKTMAFLEHCDLFVGEKLHSVILSMAAYTPSIMLEYRPKCLDFMMSMGLEEFNMRTDQLSLEKLVHLSQVLSDNSRHYQDMMFNRIKEFREIQTQRSRMLSELIMQRSL